VISKRWRVACGRHRRFRPPVQSVCGCGGGVRSGAVGYGRLRPTARAMQYGVRRLAAAFTAGARPCGWHISRQRGPAPVAKAAASRRTPKALLPLAALPNGWKPLPHKALLTGWKACAPFLPEKIASGDKFFLCTVSMCAIVMTRFPCRSRAVPVPFPSTQLSVAKKTWRKNSRFPGEMQAENLIFLIFGTTDYGTNENVQYPTRNDQWPNGMCLQILSKKEAPNYFAANTKIGLFSKAG